MSYNVKEILVIFHQKTLVLTKYKMIWLNTRDFFMACGIYFMMIPEIRQLVKVSILINTQKVIILLNEKVIILLILFYVF